jgi:hypothetical protein
MQGTTENDLDLVWGVKGIGKVIGRTERQTLHMLTTGEIPGKKVGGRWVAKREALVRFFDEVAA